MSGETQAEPSGLSVDNLSSQIHALLVERDTRFNLQIDSLREVFGAVNRDIDRILAERDSRIAAQLSSVKDLFEMRLDAIDRATDKFETGLTRIPTDTDRQVGQLREVVYETFKTIDARLGSIETQFVERDVRTEQATTSTKTAVDAALQAQKESAGKQADAFGEATKKSEDQFTKQIDLQGELLRTEVKGLVTQINELKDRINRGEGVGVGVASSKVDHQVSANYIVALVMAGLSLVGLIVVIVFDFARAH